MEHTRDRAEEKASRAEEKVCLFVKFISFKNTFSKVKALTEELGLVNKTIKSMSITGERSAEMEDSIQDKIREMKQR